VEIGSSHDGALITVRVRPRSRPGIALAGTDLVVRVAAPPAEGRATEEARRVLADALGVAPSRVVLRHGERSRTKVFLIRDMDAEGASSRLASVLGLG
jgi:uncharacterized protein YggU (UPF0235/DUF167 family)